jgi:hypothetical protein
MPVGGAFFIRKQQPDTFRKSRRIAQRKQAGWESAFSCEPSLSCPVSGRKAEEVNIRTSVLFG